MTNHYELLGLEVDASPEQIKSAYRNLAKSVHPDKHQNNPVAAEMFKTLHQCYEILGDADRRAQYDQQLNIEWLHHLQQIGVLEPFNTNLGKYTRLKGPFHFTIPQIHTDILRKEYEPSLEKGGLFLFEVGKNNKGQTLVLREVVFIENTSGNPGWEYAPDIDAFNKAINRALTKKLLPCFFHTHPTENENLIWESINYNRQMDTSSQDKLASVYAIQKGNMLLRLPELLVIGNGKLKHSLFIGAYGGLVCPLNFEERKSELMESWRKTTGNQISKFLDEPWKQALAVIAGAYLLAKYPKQVLQTAVVASAVLPPIVYDTSGENINFGIANHSDLSIKCPGISNEQVMKDEAIIDDLLRNKRNGRKAS